MQENRNIDNNPGLDKDYLKQKFEPLKDSIEITIDKLYKPSFISKLAIYWNQWFFIPRLILSLFFIAPIIAGLIYEIQLAVIIGSTLTLAFFTFNFILDNLHKEIVEFKKNLSQRFKEQYDLINLTIETLDKDLVNFNIKLKQLSQENSNFEKSNQKLNNLNDSLIDNKNQLIKEVNNLHEENGNLTLSINQLNQLNENLQDVLHRFIAAHVKDEQSLNKFMADLQGLYAQGELINQKLAEQVKFFAFQNDSYRQLNLTGAELAQKNLHLIHEILTNINGLKHSCGIVLDKNNQLQTSNLLFFPNQVEDSNNDCKSSDLKIEIEDDFIKKV